MSNLPKIVQIVAVKDGEDSSKEVLHALLENGLVLKHIPPGIRYDAEDDKDYVFGDCWELLDPPTPNANILLRKDQREMWNHWEIDPLKPFAGG